MRAKTLKKRFRLANPFENVLLRTFLKCVVILYFESAKFGRIVQKKKCEICLFWHKKIKNKSWQNLRNRKLLRATGK
jgi:hypothetical protein